MIFFFVVCLGIFIWVELKLPLLGSFLVYPAGMGFRANFRGFGLLPCRVLYAM